MKRIMTLFLILIMATPSWGWPTPGAKAKDVATTTTNFDGNLSAADNTVQKALDTLDELTAGGGGGGTWGSITGTLANQTDLQSAINAKEATANKGAASGYASLDSNSLVVQNPASASATPGANQIVISDGSGKVDGYTTLGASIDQITEITTAIKSGGSNAVKVVTTTGTATSGDLLNFNVNGNAIASGIQTSEVGRVSGSLTSGNMICSNVSGRLVDCGAAPPEGAYGDVVGSGSSVSDFLPAYSGTSGKAIVTSGISVSGASKDSLTVPGTGTFGNVVSTSTDDTKIGDVTGGNYLGVTYETGQAYSAGTGGINWSAINPLTTAGVNWTEWTDDASVNWIAVTKLDTGGGSAEWTETTPTIAAGAGAGSSPTISIEGSDGSGVIYLYTGSSTTTGATIATITFQSTFTHNPVVDGPTPMNDNAAALSAGAKPYWDYSSGSTNTAVMKSNTTELTGETEYIWGYQTIGH